MTSKFYAVKSGRKTGVFTDWNEVKKHVQGYSNAIFKSFSSIEDAEKYLYSKNELNNNMESKENFNDSTVKAFIDGSFSEEKNMYSYGVVLIEKGKIIAELNDVGNDNSALSMRNVAGELLGAMVAIKWANTNNFKKIEIFYDYFGIERWATGDWKASKEGTKKYVEFIKKHENEIEIEFIKVKAHSGNEYNERADRLASKAIEQSNSEKKQIKEPAVSSEKMDVFYEIMKKNNKNEKTIKSNIRFKGLDIDNKKLDNFVKKCWKIDGMKILNIKSKFIELNIDDSKVLWSIVDKDGCKHNFELKL